MKKGLAFLGILCFCFSAFAQKTILPQIGLDSLDRLLNKRLTYNTYFYLMGLDVELPIILQLDSHGKPKAVLCQAEWWDSSGLADQVYHIIRNELLWDTTSLEGIIYVDIRFHRDGNRLWDPYAISHGIPEELPIIESPSTPIFAPVYAPEASSKDRPVRAEVEATFPGGMDIFRDYIRDNFNYPERCQEEGINGSVLLEFVVELDGKITNIILLSETPACPYFSWEAVRILKNSPPWNPGTINGIPVRSFRTMPIQMTVGN